MSHFNESPLQSEAQQNLTLSLGPVWPLCKKKTHNMFYLLAYILDNGSGAEIAFLGATTRVWLKN